MAEGAGGTRLCGNMGAELARQWLMIGQLSTSTECVWWECQEGIASLSTDTIWAVARQTEMQTEHPQLQGQGNRDRRDFTKSASFLRLPSAHLSTHPPIYSPFLVNFKLSNRSLFSHFSSSPNDLPEFSPWFLSSNVQLSSDCQSRNHVTV